MRYRRRMPASTAPFCNIARRWFREADLNFTDKSVTSQLGRTFVVTGANTGVGLGIADVLAARGARVLLACRDAGKAQAAMAAIRQTTPAADLRYIHLDQADLDSVRDAAMEIGEEHQVDVLINNAGVIMPDLVHTRQGFELQFGVNHLGCFALTALLLPKLAQAPLPRVVVTSSLVHSGGRINWDDLNAEREFAGMKRYAASKLANALFFHELDRRLRAAGSPVMAVGCHPGVAATELGRNTLTARLVYRLMAPFINSSHSGAWPALLAATGAVQPGKYYGPTGFKEIRGPAGEAWRGPAAMDHDAARRLWDVSVKLTGIEPGLEPA